MSFNELKENDVIYARVIEHEYTKSVRKIKITRVLKDDDEISRLTGLRQSFMKYYFLSSGSKLWFSPKFGYVTVLRHGATIYYIRKEDLIRDLNRERESFSNQIDNLINSL